MISEPFPHSPELLAAFEAAPDDDGPLLILADWLQEREHPWGELIAVQCALVQEIGPTPERARLLRREHELLHTRRDWWPYDGVGFHVESFVRGFPSRIRADNVAGLRTLVSRMPWLAADDIEVPLEESSMLGLVSLERLPSRGFTLTSGSNYYFDLLDAKMFVRWLERHALVPSVAHRLSPSLQHFLPRFASRYPQPKWGARCRPCANASRW